jgi:hypothetical protein
MKTYDINLTAAELETIYFALNDLSLKYMHKSRTYGNPDAKGEMDYAHERANEITALQIRIGDVTLENNDNNEQ